MRVVWVAALLLSAMVVQAQSPDASNPAPETSVLYLHTNGDDSSTWMNTLESDGANDYYTVADLTDPMTETTRTASFALVPGATAPLRFDPEGEATFRIFWGQGIGAARASVSVALTADGTTIAEASAAAANRAMAYTEAVLTSDISVEEVPAGAEIVLSVSFTGSGDVFISVGGAGRSRVELPLVAVPEPESGPTTLDIGNASLQFNASTNASYVLNLTAGTWVITHNLTAGTLNYTLAADNATVAQGALNGTGNSTIGTLVGNGTLNFTVHGVVGDLTVHLRPSGAPDNGTVEPDPTDASGNTTSQTIDGTGGNKAPVPLAVLPILAAVLARKAKR